MIGGGGGGGGGICAPPPPPGCDEPKKPRLDRVKSKMAAKYLDCVKF